MNGITCKPCAVVVCLGRAASRKGPSCVLGPGCGVWGGCACAVWGRVCGREQCELPVRRASQPSPWGRCAYSRTSEGQAPQYAAAAVRSVCTQAPSASDSRRSADVACKLDAHNMQCLLCRAYRSMVERRGVRWRCRQWVVIGVVVVPVGRLKRMCAYAGCGYGRFTFVGASPPTRPWQASGCGLLHQAPSYSSLLPRSPGITWSAPPRLSLPG